MKSKKGKKSGKFAPENDDDLYPILAENEDDTKKIDGKRKDLKPPAASSTSKDLVYEQDDGEEADDADDYPTSLVDFSGLKKKNNKKKGKEKTATGFSALLDQEEEEEDEEGKQEKEKEDDEEEETGKIIYSEVLEDEHEEHIDFSSLKKKKSKSKEKDPDKEKSRNLTDQQQDGGLNAEVIDDLNDADYADSIDFSGMKKKKKKEKNISKGFESLADDEDINAIPAAKLIQDSGRNEDNDLDNIDFTGLKKKKKKKEKETGKGPSVNMGSQDIDSILAELGGPTAVIEQVEIESSDITESKALNDADEADSIDFSGLKKKKKGKKEKSKGIDSKAADDEDIDAILAQLDGPKNVIQHESQESISSNLHQDSIADVSNEADLPESAASKKKKKKKEKEKGKVKSKQTEDEDIDAILAQLDEEKIEENSETNHLQAKKDVEPPQEEKQQQEVSKEEAVLEEEEGGVESAAAKKKKKKKEREKAKKDVEPPQEDKQQQEVSKGKVPDKKVPKHVREMQERLAKQKEAEERVRREEEERRLKEEEEQRRLEELERQKEEAKKRRKEREKEKLLKKKQEGKLLTGKQKEEARRLALMREQLLAQKGLVEGDSAIKDEAAPKKPKYENKKKRRPQGGESISVEVPNVQDQEVPSVPEEPHIEVVVEKEPETEPEVVIVEEETVVEEDEEEEEEEEKEEEDWDAKSWDDDKIELPPVKSAFAEEEEEETKESSKNTTKSSITQVSRKLPIQKDAVPSSLAKPQAKAAPVSNGIGSEEEETESEEEESDSEEEDTAEERRRREAILRRNARRNEALANRSAEDLRSPICCILGHVDTGKTKLLDCIRRTNVQEGEAGGITQQIGATYFPMENIQERTKELKNDVEVKLPGLLVIDTPGHESFTNLRSRGSGLCDIAILVVDIMHGLEPQTIESLNLLKMRHTPFIVALNKVDRLYSWKSVPNSPIVKSLQRQTRDVTNEFERRTSQIITELQEQGLNSELYHKNKDKRKVVSIVPTSAISGEGVPDMLMLLVNLTQKVMKEKLMYMSEVECTVLEVKVIEGLGTTIDVILVNGILHEGDQIVVCGMQGPIVTTIRALLTPHPMKELRVKGSYQHHKELKAAQGIKITAQGLEHAIAGTQLHVVGPDDDLDVVKEEAMQDMKNVMSRVDKSGEGVCVQASTLGSLEALLEFLKSPAVKIPVSGINIGPVHKRDVMRASVMLERKKKEYATILAFDVKVTPEAKELAEEVGVRIFMADIIYHLFDQFTAYMKNVKEEKRKDVADEAVFPCVLSIKPQYVFNKKDPIILGVDVLEGIARIGTPLCVPSQDMISIGRIASMEVNHKVVDVAKKGQAVAMKIVGSTAEETQKMFGRHFDHEDELVSHITRRSIDVLKENFRDELSVEEWKLVVKLKKLFNIP